MSDNELDFIPVKKPIPWSNPVMIAIPEDFWTDDWCRGVRSKTYIGMICCHSNPDEAEICVQPPSHHVQHLKVPCVPIKDFDKCNVIVLEGKLSDYV